MDNITYISQGLTGIIPLTGFIIVLLPLFSFLIINLINLNEKVDSGMITSVIIGTALAGSVFLFINIWNTEAIHVSFIWLKLFAREKPVILKLGLLFDNVSVFMILVVLVISFVVHLFSIDYMKGELHYRRFFSLLGFFTFSMLGFILADNLLMMFIFWELIGFSSYVLIGFWFRKSSAAIAARKTFIINRIADIGFLIAVMILWSRFGTLDLSEIKIHLSAILGGTAVPHMKLTWLFFAGFGLFIAAVGKSAQFPLLVWLPDAMEGPIPVSALIHAATMVTAGVFLLARTFAILTLPVLAIITITGTLSSFMGAIAALSQYDLKKVLAYSTISQLGFMIMGIGVGAREPALFHLFTHAFFKAGLFLVAGMIIKSLNDLKFHINKDHFQFNSQDMRQMGGLKSSLPFAFIVFTVFSAALAGIPFFSGFLSKDTILNGSLAWAKLEAGKGAWIAYLVPVFGFLTSFITVLYIGRALILIFFGRFRLQESFPDIPEVTGKLRQRPWIAGIPVMILSVLSLAIIFSINPFSPGYSWVLAHIKPGISGFYSTLSLQMSDTLTGIAENYQYVTGFLSLVVSVCGVITVFYLYGKRKNFMPRLQRITEEPDFFQALSYNNWYLDGFYRAVLIRPFTAGAFMVNRFEKKVLDRFVDLGGISMVAFAHITGWIDRAIVDGMARLSALLFSLTGKLVGSMQSGKIQQYYIWAVFILILLILWWSL